MGDEHEPGVCHDVNQRKHCERTNSMGSFEGSYPAKVLRTFTQEQQAQLRTLHERLDGKVDEIASHVAEQLGKDKADPTIREEALEAIERWEQDVEMRAAPPKPVGKLQHLLSEHHLISENIMDVAERGGGELRQAIIKAIMEWRHQHRPPS